MLAKSTALSDWTVQTRKNESARVSGFARRLLAEWQSIALEAAADGGVVIAVSGGADSTALLLAFDELSKAQLIDFKLTVAHLNHQLRGPSSDEDAQWVAELSDRLGHEIILGDAPVRTRASAQRDNLEQAARRARYKFLSDAAQSCGARAVLTAHIIDDQAETVLLNLLRGSGTEGLSGMPRLRVLDAGGDVMLIRPLLSWARRADTEEFCRERSVGFRTDAMNEDERFARVRVRRKLLPLLETFNPRAVEALARTADLLRDDVAALEEQAAQLLHEAVGSAEKNHEAMSETLPLRVDVLRAATPAIQRRALRQWIACGRGNLRRVELTHITAVAKLLTGERGGRIAELPGGSFVERRRGWIRLQTKNS